MSESSRGAAAEGGQGIAGGSGDRLSPRTEVVVATNQTSVNLDGQVVILGIDSGKYYRLDEVGARIWELLREPRSVDSIVDSVVDEYEVGRDLALTDVRELLARLLREGLIVIPRQIP